MDRQFLIAALEDWIRNPGDINCNVLCNLLLDYIDDPVVKYLASKLKVRCNEE